MVAGSPVDRSLPEYSWTEVAEHTTLESRWIVVDNFVYDITRFARKHPGGSKVINHYAGQDASEAFRAFHSNEAFVRKYMTALRIGKVAPVVDAAKAEEELRKNAALKSDFEALRLKVKEMGLFKANPVFFSLYFLQIILLDIAAIAVILSFGGGWLSIIVSCLLNATLQAQAGWLQHDFGHLSVFSRPRLNHAVHAIAMSFMKGASAHWWNHLHYQHHAKPNIMGKDPDVRIQPLFVLGQTMPKEVAEEAQKKKPKFQFPYHLQHKYFFAIGPPLLFPVYFQIMTFRHAILRRRYLDLFFMFCFFAKLFYFYGPVLGYFGTLAFYFTFRLIESHWFTWVTQSNHIPMDIDHDSGKAWLTLQIHATCDIEQSAFNDWFTGHLNFQIEHHLFPLMPRHNYWKVQPMVRELCERHNIPFQMKSLYQAFADIVRSLQHSGELWQAAMHAYHLD